MQSMSKMFPNIPKIKLLVLMIVTLISSLDGIVTAQLLKFVASVSLSNLTISMIRILLWGGLGLGTVYTSLYLSSVIKSSIFATVSVQLKMKFFSESLISGQKTSDVLSFLNNDFKLLETNYYDALFSSIYSGCVAIASFTYLMTLNKTVGVLFIIFSAASLWITTKLQKPLEQISLKWSDSNSKTMNFVKGIFNGRTSALVYGPRSLIDHLHALNQSTEQAYRYLNVRTMRVAWVGWLLSIISYLVPISVGVYLMESGAALTGADLLAMFLASDRVVGPLRNIGQYRAQIRTTKAIRARIPDHSNTAQLNSKEALSSNEYVSLNIDNFTYKMKNKAKIHINHLRVNPGSNILISGESGIGKSTLLSLIVGATSQDSAQIALTNKNNQPIKSETRSAFALISQLPFVFSGTVAENLTLMQPGFKEVDMINALKSVGLSSELGETPLDYIFSDDKDNLSGGQKQRLAVARALLFKRPIIICDEITSALDNQSARQVRKALYLSSSTIIEVAHHFNVIDFNQYGIQHYVMRANDENVVQLFPVDANIQSTSLT